jgi:hypothetical protein
MFSNIKFKLKMTAGVVDADAVSAYFAENLDEPWVTMVTTATTDCIAAVESSVCPMAIEKHCV